MPLPPPHPHRARHAVRVFALLVALALPWSSAAFAQTRPLPDTPPSRLGTDGEGTRSTPGATMHHRAGSGSTDLQAAVMRGMREMETLSPSGNVDHDFAALMRAHHQSGVEMARIQLQNGKDPELRRMAREIIEQQNREIDAFERWLKAHPQPAAPGERPERP